MQMIQKISQFGLFIQLLIINFAVSWSNEIDEEANC